MKMESLYGRGAVEETTATMITVDMDAAPDAVAEAAAGKCLNKSYLITKPPGSCRRFLFLNWSYYEKTVGFI